MDLEIHDSLYWGRTAQTVISRRHLYRKLLVHQLEYIRHITRIGLECGESSGSSLPPQGQNEMTIRILLVDDHPIVRHGLKTILEGRIGWEVIGEAADGAEAVEKAGKLNPDVMVLDVTMPNMNGLEACRLLRRQSPQLEILFVTQHDSPQMMREALDAGARGYVVKSNAARDLLEAVEAVSQHRIFTALNGRDLAGLH